MPRTCSHISVVQLFDAPAIDADARLHDRYRGEQLGRYVACCSGCDLVGYRSCRTGPVRWYGGQQATDLIAAAVVWNRELMAARPVAH